MSAFQKKKKKRLTFTIAKPNRPHKSHLTEYAKRVSNLQITVPLVVDPLVSGFSRYFFSF